MTTLDEARVLEHMTNGQTVTWLLSASGWTLDQIKAFAHLHGFGVNSASGRFQRVAKPKPAPAGVVRHPADARPAHRDLIDEGKASSVARVQRAAVKAEVALKTLADLLDATRAAEAERAAKAEAEAKRLARIAEIKAELAALTGRRAAAATAVVAPKQAGASARDIRAWAASAGVDCPAKGKVPQRVVDQFLAATEAGAA